MSMNLILDIVIIVLLVPTIIYALILNRNLKVLRESKGEFTKLIEAFNQATARAEQSIPKLRNITDDASKKLQEHVDKAHNLRDDLAFMVETANSTADRLENSARTARKDGRKPIFSTKKQTISANKIAPVRKITNKRGSKKEETEKFAVEDERSEAERELLRALQSAR